MRKEYFRGVVWPQQTTKEEPKLYKYTIVGVIVSDKPLEFSGGNPDNEIVLDGNCWGLSDAVQGTNCRHSNIRLGDANNVLLSLEDI